MSSGFTILSIGGTPEELVRDRIALLLQHFSEIDDERDPLLVLYPLAEATPLLVCATISA